MAVEPAFAVEHRVGQVRVTGPVGDRADAGEDGDLRASGAGGEVGRIGQPAAAEHVSVFAGRAAVDVEGGAEVEIHIGEELIEQVAVDETEAGQIAVHVLESLQHGHDAADISASLLNGKEKILQVGENIGVFGFHGLATADEVRDEVRVEEALKRERLQGSGAEEGFGSWNNRLQAAAAG